jgi:very-short-patch-repair endonuclease
VRAAKRFGVEVLRFTNVEVFENMEGVAHRIEEAFEQG